MRWGMKPTFKCYSLCNVTHSCLSKHSTSLAYGGRVQGQHHQLQQQYYQQQRWQKDPISASDSRRPVALCWCLGGQAILSFSGTIKKCSYQYTIGGSWPACPRPVAIAGTDPGEWSRSPLLGLLLPPIPASDGRACAPPATDPFHSHLTTQVAETAHLAVLGVALPA